MCKVPRGKSVNILQVSTRLLTPKNRARYIVFFYKNLFENNDKKTLSEQSNFSDTLQIPKLSDHKSLLCKGKLTESELYFALKNMPNNKSPGSDRLRKEFYLLSFWDDIKDIYIYIYIYIYI